ncbi:MAG: ATP-binding protein [Kangiellaceae bacterium]|jgi:PAS domain S-box-containing protein|nr:ATP-binding protein [Kangiellaceae bacterium]
MPLGKNSLDFDNRLFEQLPASLLIVDHNGRIYKITDFGSRMFGYQPNELLDVNISKIFPNLSLSEQLVKLSSTTEQKILSLNSIAQCKNHHSIAVDITVKQYEDDTLLISSSDASERQKAVDALNNSQSINKAGTWSFNLISNEVWWSPELFRIFELPLSDLAPPYETHMSLFSPESWQRLEPAVAAAAEQGIPYELELQLSLKTKDNKPRYAIARCEPQLDKNNKVTELIGTFQDITELALARAERDRLLERLKLAKSAAQMGLWEWHRSTGELVWDDTIYDLYGIEQKSITYQDWRDAVHPSDVETAEKELLSSVESESLFHSRFRIIKNGEIRHISAFAVTKGDVVTGLNMDVTAEVKHQEEVLRMNNLDALGALAGGIAHDFNNQLASILGRTELIAINSKDSDYVIKMAKGLMKSVESAKALTKQLLTFSKGDTPIKESTSITELIQQNVEFSLHGASLSVNYRLPSVLWNAEVDPHQIGQVIQNIVINAVQAMNKPGGELIITAENTVITKASPQLSDGDYLKLTITDNGPGIQAEEVSRIFDPYYSTKAEGNGLGLAICHSIVTKHGGNIEVLSEADQGTTFVIHLPATTKPAIPLHKSESIKTGKGKLLVVDDMPEVLDLLTEMVESIGYDCQPAASVEDAVKLYQEALSLEPFDLVLTDLTMPGSGGGVEVLERLKEIDESVKVIVVSGYADKYSLANADSMGFSGKLKKPCGLAELSEEIMRVTG